MGLDLTEIIVALLGILGVSGGFWTWVAKKRDAESATTKLIMGLALDRIVQTGSDFVDKGYVTVDEYGDFRKYLYDPYKELGGNGTADKTMVEVDKLPTKPNHLQQSAVTFQLQRGQGRQ